MGLRCAPSTGDFTRYAAAVLAASAALSHEQFLSEVLRRFGDARRQTPRLDCGVWARSSVLFGAPPGD